MKKKFFVFLGMSILLALLFAGCTAEIDNNLVQGKYNSTAAADTYPYLVVAKPSDANICVSVWNTATLPSNASTANAYYVVDAATGELVQKASDNVFYGYVSQPNLPNALAERRALYPDPTTTRPSLILEPFTLDGLTDLAVVDINYKATLTKATADGIPITNSNWGRVKIGDVLDYAYVIEWTWKYKIPSWDVRTGAQKVDALGALVYTSVAATGKSAPSKVVKVTIQQATPGLHYNP